MGLPLRRFVICLEDLEGLNSPKDKEKLKWLEFPLLILFWRLGGVLPIEYENSDDRNNDIIWMGKISPKKIIEIPTHLVMNDKNSESAYFALIEFITHRIKGISFSKFKLRAPLPDQAGVCQS